MSLETIIASLVTAANNLTNVVSGKMGQIDQKMADAQAKFDQFRALKDVVGTPGVNGTLTTSIFQGQIYGTGGTISVGADGDFTSADLGASVNVYIHLKLPINVRQVDRMFWVNIRGYSYGSAKVIEETVVGYSYLAQNTLVNTNAVGNMTPAVYIDTNGNVVVRILVPSIYITTLRIDSMRVGSNPAIAVGEIKSKLSLADKVVF